MQLIFRIFIVKIVGTFISYKSGHNFNFKFFLQTEILLVLPTNDQIANWMQLFPSILLFFSFSSY